MTLYGLLRVHFAPFALVIRLRPVAVHVSYHKDAPAYMDALISRYQRRDSSALQPLLIERLSKEQATPDRLVGFRDVRHPNPYPWNLTALRCVLAA